VCEVWLTCLRVWWFSPVPPFRWYFKLGHDHFHPYRLQFIIHSLYHLALCGLSYWLLIKVVLFSDKGGTVVINMRAAGAGHEDSVTTTHQRLYSVISVVPHRQYYYERAVRTCMSRVKWLQHTYTKYTRVASLAIPCHLCCFQWT
jgi:hypothetical protein